MSFSKIKKTRKQDKVNRPVVSEVSKVGESRKAVATMSWDSALRQVKAEKDDELKAELKKSMIGRFLPAALNYVKTGVVEVESLMVFCALWCFDLGKIGEAVKLSIFIVENDVEKPSWFKDDLQNTLTFQFLAWASPKVNAGQSLTPYFDEFFLASENWEELDDIKRATLLVIKAKIAHQEKDFDKAVELYEAAAKINPRAGVVTNLAKAKKKQEFQVKPVKS